MTDIGILRGEIRQMTRKAALYRALKEELGVLGYWKNRARGNPSKGWKASKGLLGKG